MERRFTAPLGTAVSLGDVAPPATGNTAEHRGKRFVVNVMWNWLATIVSLFIGFVLSPYLIRKLGPDSYGVWALSFSLVEYYWFFDFGFRAATVKFVAHYSATGDANSVQAVINTVLVYSSLVAVTVLVAAGVLSRYVERFFQIPDALRDNFQLLLLIITLSWCLGLVFNVFNACLEAVQYFEFSSKVSIISATIRAAGQGILLFLGYKLIAIGVIVVVSQAVGYYFNYIYFRKVFPGQRLSIRFSRISTMREMAGFGVHTFVMTVSNQLLNQAAPLLIGHYRPAAFVGYYNLPMRLLQYTVEMVGRVGIVTNTNAAELAAKGRSKDLSDLAVYTNRYCLLVFMPLAILLWTYGPQLFVFWVGAQFAAASAPVLPILLVGFVVAVVGQFSASMLLQGLAKHQRYARSLLAEACVGFLLLVFAVPRWGIRGAAFVVAGMMIVNRGLGACWLVSRVIGLPFLRYLFGVYGWPALTMLPVLGLSLWLRSTFLPGASWLQLLTAAAIVASAYYSLAFFVALDRPHRATLVGWIRNRLIRGLTNRAA